MTKSEQREITKLKQYRWAGADSGMIARALSALIRSCRTSKSRAELMAYADTFNVAKHPEFII